MRIGLFFLILINSATVFAAVTPALSFYRNQQSAFPSGQMNRADLEKKIIRRELEPWFRVSWNKKEFEIPGEIVVKDIQTTRTLIAKEKSEVLKSPLSGSVRAFSLEPKRTVLVIKTSSMWAEVVDLKLRLRGWAPLANFTAPEDDRGVYVTLIDSFLQKSPNGSAGVITTIPRGVRLTPLDIEKNFLKVNYKDFKGYVDLSNLVGRGDFAMWAFHRVRGWIGISHRENGYLMTTDKQKIPLG
ncbi:MAG: SH3 domain-containing protein, partial [Bdellovibrionaceae bacterium]|nr:SH3 domain-containing protein [Pseudobdellovibrionaceae bacterium]